jgi:RimJ/RimL family protein N-acetyltransferase
MTAERPVTRVLEGRVIRLEPYTHERVDELYEAIGRSEVFAGGWGGGPAGFRSDREGFAAFISAYLDPVLRNVYLVCLGDRVVGTTTLGDFDLGRESAHLGWTAYAPDVWGSAVNPEAKLLVLGEAFDSGFGRVKLQADVLNDRSRAAILKLGATFEGITRRDQRRADGSWRDAAIYSIVGDEWPAVRAGLEARITATLG